jgi:hypothetical protein
MTDSRSGGDIGKSPQGVGFRATGSPLRLSPLGVDVAVAVSVFGASVVNVAAQDPATEIADTPLPGS